MHEKTTYTFYTRSHARRLGTLVGLTAAAALALAACGGGTTPTSVPSINVPTVPAGEACLDAPTMAILDQIRAAGADAPTLLAENKGALITGLGGLESSDPDVTAWRDALVDALESDDMTAAAAEVARLANNEVNVASC